MIFIHWRSEAHPATHPSSTSSNPNDPTDDPQPFAKENVRGTTDDQSQLSDHPHVSPQPAPRGVLTILAPRTIHSRRAKENVWGRSAHARVRMVKFLESIFNFSKKSRKKFQ